MVVSPTVVTAVFHFHDYGRKSKHHKKQVNYNHLPGIPATIKTMGVNITTIVYLRVLIIQIGSTIILMVVEA